MLDTIVQSHERLSNFLSTFRDAFENQPQYRHFQAHVIGLLIYLGSRNLAGLSRAIPDRKRACSLYRFVAEMDWDADLVEQVRWEMLNRRTRRALQAVGRRGQPVLGHVWVPGHLVILGQRYPLGWKLYRRRTMCETLAIPCASEPELAGTILRQFEALPGTQTYVLTDTWYPSQDLLNLCHERAFHLISAVKSDRKFKAAGHNLQVKQWAQTLPKRVFGPVTVNTTCHKV